MEQFNPNNGFYIPQEQKPAFKDAESSFNKVSEYWQQGYRPPEKRKRIGLLMFIVVMVFIGISGVMGVAMVVFSEAFKLPEDMFTLILLLLNTAAITIGAVLVPSLIFIFKGKKPAEKFNLMRLHGNQIVPCIMIGIGLCAAMYAASVMLDAIYSAAGVSLQDNASVIPSGHSIISFIITTLCIAVAPAICEELLCRSAILYSMRRLGMYRAALWSGLFFALLHVNLVSLPIYVAIGYIFGIIAYKSRSVFSTMIIHFVYNFSIVALEFALPAAENSDKAEAVALLSPELWLVVGFLAFAAAVFLVPGALIFKFNCRRNDAREAAKAGLTVTEFLDGYNEGGDYDPYLGKGFVIAAMCILAATTVLSGLSSFLKMPK